MFKKLITSHRLRQRVNWIIAAVLILPFILFFHASFRSPNKGAGGVAGELFGKPVPWDTFQRELQWVRTQWQARLGDIPEGMNVLLAPQAWERLMLLHEAKRNHLQVSDQDLAEMIQGLPLFQENGRFVPERYHRYLAALGMTPPGFEELLRHDLLIERLITSRKGNVSVTDEEIMNAYQQAHERVRASLIRRDVEPLRDTVSHSITDEEIRAYYDAHPDAVQIPARITLDYIGLTTEELGRTLTVSDQEIEDYYTDHPDEFRTEANAAKPLAEVREAIRQRLVNQQASRRLVDLAMDAEDALDAKGTFEELAARVQLPIRTVGPLPVDGPGGPEAPEAPVLEAARSLQEGQISRVVETDHGVYVVRVSKREPMRLPPLEEVRPAIVERVVTEKARATAKADADSLRSRLQSKLAEDVTFEEAAGALGVTPHSPAPFTRTDPIEGLGPVPQVNAAVFAAAPDQPTDVLETPSAFVFLIPRERLAAEAAGLTDAERTRLRDQLVSAAQQTRLAAWLEDVRARAKLKSYIEETPASPSP